MTVVEIKQVDRAARKRFYDSTDADLSTEALAKLDQAFATQRSTHEARLAEAVRDLAATYDAAKSGKPIEISLGQWRRLAEHQRFIQETERG